MKDLKKKSKNVLKGPVKGHQEKLEEFDPLKKIENVEYGKDDADALRVEHPVSIEDAFKEELVELDDSAKPTLEVGKVCQPDYLKEGSPEALEVQEQAREQMKKLVVTNEYGSSEWNLITSSVNQALGYTALTHAMPIGYKGNRGVIIKTTVIQNGTVSVHTLYDSTVRILPDPEAKNLSILV